MFRRKKIFVVYLGNMKELKRFLSREIICYKKYQKSL